MRKNYKFLRVDEETANKFKRYKEYMEKTKGGKWTTSKILQHLLSLNNKDSLNDKILEKFNMIKTELDSLLRLHSFSNEHRESLIEEISVFEAYILQQINGHLDIKIGKEMLINLPRKVKEKTENKKDGVERD